MIQRIESGEPLVGTAGLVRLASTAGRVGINSNDVTYSATYEELVSSGDLGLIRDAKSGHAIVDRFRMACRVQLIEHPPHSPMKLTWRRPTGRVRLRLVEDILSSARAPGLRSLAGRPA